MDIRRKQLAAAAAGTALISSMLGAEVVRAQSAPAIIYACANTLTGLLRLASGPHQCSALETPVQWTSTGPPGPPGPGGRLVMMVRQAHDWNEWAVAIDLALGAKERGVAPAPGLDPFSAPTARAMLRKTMLGWLKNIVENQSASEAATRCLTAALSLGRRDLNGPRSLGWQGP